MARREIRYVEQPDMKAITLVTEASPRVIVNVMVRQSDYMLWSDDTASKQLTSLLKNLTTVDKAIRDTKYRAHHGKEPKYDHNYN